MGRRVQRAEGCSKRKGEVGKGAVGRVQWEEECRGKGAVREMQWEEEFRGKSAVSSCTVFEIAYECDLVLRLAYVLASPYSESNIQYKTIYLDILYNHGW